MGGVGAIETRAELGGSRNRRWKGMTEGTREGGGRHHSQQLLWGLAHDFKNTTGLTSRGQKKTADKHFCPDGDQRPEWRSKTLGRFSVGFGTAQ